MFRGVEIRETHENVNVHNAWWSCLDELHKWHYMTWTHLPIPKGVTWFLMNKQQYTRSKLFPTRQFLFVWLFQVPSQSAVSLSQLTTIWYSCLLSDYLKSAFSGSLLLASSQGSHRYYNSEVPSNHWILSTTCMLRLTM